MASKLRTTRWITARTLHQIQLLSCDLCEFTAWEVSDHCAPFWRLYHHNRHGAEITLGKTVVPLRPGHLILIPPNTHFSSRLKAPFRQLFLHFLLEPQFTGQRNTVFQLRATREQAACCRELTALLARDPSDLRLSFLGQLLASHALLSLPAQNWAPRFADARITLAVDAITKAYPARLSNASLAKKARLHPSSFIRLFRDCTGHTPLQYLTNLRLAEACSMLHHDEASLDEIAERTGLGDRAYFTRLFTRHMNCPPARYRHLVNVSHRQRPGA